MPVAVHIHEYRYLVVANSFNYCTIFKPFTRCLHVSFSTFLKRNRSTSFDMAMHKFEPGLAAGLRCQA
ncbi:Uncharacterized protein HZ326_12758 [Fusarium oxysporum f. sp. albedinis]|nr:Uncharacterized protein HZ326_12758 [Fusarium oxysporum f. sp. albedinis]